MWTKPIWFQNKISKARWFWSRTQLSKFFANSGMQPQAAAVDDENAMIKCTRKAVNLMVARNHITPQTVGLLPNHPDNMEFNVKKLAQIRAEPLLEVYVSSKLPHWVKRYFISNNFIWEKRGCASCEHGTLSSSFTNPCRKCILRAKSHASSSALNHDLKELQYSDGRFHKALQMKITKYHACTKKNKTWMNQINKTIFI